MPGRAVHAAVSLGRAVIVRSSRTALLTAGAALLAAGGASLLAGCGSAEPARRAPALPPALVAEARPIGSGARFHPPATGPVVGRCRPRLGARFGVHIEVFAANRVVLVAGGIGTRPPRALTSGRISRARCYGALVTLDPTGVVLVRRGARLRLSDLFRAWGEPLSPVRVASFRATRGTRVVVFVDARRRHAAPGNVPLSRHAEIVLEVGPYVPPHPSYTFPPGA